MWWEKMAFIFVLSRRKATWILQIHSWIFFAGQCYYYIYLTSSTNVWLCYHINVYIKNVFSIERNTELRNKIENINTCMFCELGFQVPHDILTFENLIEKILLKMESMFENTLYFICSLLKESPLFLWESVFILIYVL